MGRDDLSGKPEQIKEKIVEEKDCKKIKRISFTRAALHKDSSLTVEQLVKQTAGKIGENLKIRRFTRYTLGEGIEVKELAFADEVASLKN